jgi:hypothetical protein
MTEANEEEVTSGLLPFTINGEVRQVPELKWRANREWREQMQAVFTRLIDVPTDTPDGLAAMADAERELVLAYDVTHALGDLEDATERDIDTIYNRLVEVAFPLAASQAAVAMAMLQAAASARVSSTSSPSPSGTSAPTPLRRRSPSARSSSTTRRRASA